MNVSSLSGLTGLQQQQKIKRTEATLQTALANLLTGQKTDDVAALSIATQLQAKVSSIKQVSSNIAQATSLAQVADRGLEQTQKILGDLQSLAQQASGALNDDNRKALNEQFKQGLAALEENAKNTQFNSKKLLDGSLKGDKALSLNALLSASNGGDDVKLSIEDISPSALFGDQSLSVDSIEKAKAAFSEIGNAINQVATQRASVASFQETLDYASATLDSAVANQEAARSELQDSDFLENTTISSQAKVQREATIALAVQGNRLPASLLRLVG